jgi:hypothetical protein
MNKTCVASFESDLVRFARACVQELDQRVPDHKHTEEDVLRLVCTLSPQLRKAIEAILLQRTIR